jgi:NADH-ubiquinone oxidoreductase chain 2
LYAYSTISHVGFILLGLSVNSVESIQAYIFYIITYTISNLNAFLILLAIGYSLYSYTNKYLDNSNLDKQNILSHQHKMDRNYSPLQLISELKGYYYINSFLAISLSITLFSFVGVPPLFGFFAKQMILSAALDSGYYFMTLIAILTSVIGAVYYLSLIKQIFFFKSDYVRLTSSFNKKEGDTSNNIINIAINTPLSLIISFITLLLLSFILMPNQ